ncbi:MAG TPA: TonB-dependent receptor plug domain-containing protein, partial [Pyrinomonadaceae bacterium]|nr:TonB-dependent receptor plug domain-containing protein [Pyrinomonadaceae bacterium]
MNRISWRSLILVVSAFLFVLTQSTFVLTQTGGEGSLAGKVSDPQGASLPGATVRLYARARNLRFSTSTDASGTYHFEKLGPGEYLVEAEAEGLASTSAQLVVIEPGKSATVDIPLALSGVRTTVVVTASDSPQSVDEVSKAVTVIDRREIDERDEVAITEALRTVPGLRVQQLGGPGSFTSIKTRGLRNEDTAVLIDGLRFRDAAAPQGDASGFLEDLMVTDLSRVEVLRGSGSSLYGSNAIGGVINLVTDEGGGPFHGSVLAEGGGLGMFRGRAQLAGGTSNNRVVYSAGVSHLNVASGLDGQDEVRNTNGQGRVLFNVTPTATLSGRIYAANSRVQLNNNPEGIGSLPPSGIINAVALSTREQRRYEAGVPVSLLNLGGANFVPGVNDPDNLRNANFFSGALVWSQRPTEAFGYTLSYQGLKSKRTGINGPLGVGFQPFGGTEQSDFDALVQTAAARFDI